MTEAISGIAIFTIIWIGLPLYGIDTSNKRIAKALEDLCDLAGKRR